MKIGNVEINGYAALAPMAGVADRAFRELCADFGAAYVVGEMVSSKGIVYNSEKSLELLELTESERPAAVQLFGCEPDVMAEAAKIAEKYNPNGVSCAENCMQRFRLGTYEKSGALRRDSNSGKGSCCRTRYRKDTQRMG